MRLLWASSAFAAATVVLFSSTVLALGQASFVAFEAAPGDVVLAQRGEVVPMFLDADDHAGVLRAAADLQADFERVTGARPELVLDRAPTGVSAVIIGTLGRSSLVEELTANGKIDADVGCGILAVVCGGSGHSFWYIRSSKGTWVVVEVGSYPMVGFYRLGAITSTIFSACQFVFTIGKHSSDSLG